MTLRVTSFDSFDALPDRYSRLLAVAEERGLFSRREWFDLLVKHRLTRGQAYGLFAVEEEISGRPLLLIPLYESRLDGAASGARTYASVVHFENYSPVCILVDPESPVELRDLLATLFAALSNPDDDGNILRADVIRLVPFAAGSQLGVVVTEALKDAGFAIQIYQNSYNQFETTAGIGYEEYLARRSSNQRYNSRRRRRKLEKQGAVEFSMVTNASDPELLSEAIDEYILVSIRSWKSSDSTVNRLIIDWMELAAQLGYLRLGILRLDGKAIAAQFWTCSGGVANNIRTNFREDMRDLAPGIVLTNMTIEYLLDVDHVDLLDLGLGNEKYKGRWVDGSSTYGGIMAFNPTTLKGKYFGYKHILGRPLRRALKRLRRVLKGGSPE